MRIPRAVLISACIAGLPALPAAAATVFAFEGLLGEVWQSAGAGRSTPPWLTEIGTTTVSGTFRYEETAAGAPCCSTGVWLYLQTPPSSIVFEVGDAGWDSEIPATYISTSTGPGQTFQLNAEDRAAPPELQADWIELWIQLVGGPAGSVLPGVIPTDLDQHPWSVRETFTVFGWDCTVADCSALTLAWQLTFDLTQLTAVPEPGTGALVALGVAHLARRRSARRGSLARVAFRGDHSASGRLQRSPAKRASSRSVVTHSQPDSMARAAR